MPRVARSAEPGALGGTAAQGPDVGWLAALGLTAIVGARAIDPALAESGPVICPFRLLTGLPCPGCGLTRSWIYLMHGQWGEGFAVNPFGAVALAAVLTLISGVVLAHARGRRLLSVETLMSHAAVKVVAGGWVVFGVARAVAVATGSG